METARYTVIQVEADEALQEVLVALLADEGYEGFVQTDRHLEAYLPETDYAPDALNAILDQLGLPLGAIRTVEAENWNAKWEADYPSVSVGTWVHIHPAFRAAEPGFAHTLAITPQMSFGTGHHATTRLMLSHLQHLELAGKQVLDMGCGTGVLGILAARLGAHVTLIDIEPWAVENTRENLAQNHVTGTVLQGDRSAIPAGARYGAILANINRNVLLADIPLYADHLLPGGWLVLSGLFDFDAPLILEKLETSLLAPVAIATEDGWWSARAQAADNR